MASGVKPMAGSATRAMPMGGRKRGRSQTRKPVGAGSRDDKLSSPLRDELGHALLVAPAPPPREALRVAPEPGRCASSSCPRVGAGRTPAVRRPAPTSGVPEAAQPAGPRAAPLGAGSAISGAGRGLAEAHRALLDAEGSGPRGHLSCTYRGPPPTVRCLRSSSPPRSDKGSDRCRRTQSGADAQPATITQRPLRLFAQTFAASGTAPGSFPDSPIQMMRTSPHDTTTLL